MRCGTLGSAVRCFVSTLAVVAALASSGWAGTVFVVDSYHEAYPWSRVCRQGLLEGFQNDVSPVFFEMDTRRRPASEFAERADKAWEACRALSPDVVVLMDDYAVRYLGARMSGAGFNVVFMGVNDNPRRYFPSNSIPSNVSGVLERALGLRLVRDIGELLPTFPQRILVLMDTSITSEAIIRNSFGGQVHTVVSGIAVDVLLTDSSDDWRRRVQSLADSQYDAVIIGSYASLKDAAGRQVPLDETSRWTAKASPLPVFALWDISVGKGKAIGGLVVDGRKQGRDAAFLVNRVLNDGIVPPIQYGTRARLVFSRHELDRWKLVLPERMEQHADMEE